MKKVKKKSGSLRWMNRVMILWFSALIIVPVIIFTDACSMLSKKSPGKYLQAGTECYNKKNYAKAYKNYTKAIEENQFSTDAYWNRAIVAALIDSSERAIDDWSMFINIDKNADSLCTAYYNRGSLMFRQGYKSDACDDWRASCELNRKSSNNSCEQYRLHCR